MKQKHLVIFGVLLTLLVVAVIFKRQQKPAELVTEEYVPLNLSFDTAKVAVIEIGKDKDLKVVEIKKDASGAWVLPTFFNSKADEKKIQGLFKTILEAKGELRAKDKALLADFGLSEAAAYRIGFLDASGKPVFTLLVGSKRPLGAAVFVSKTGSEQVFYTEADLLGLIGIYGDPEKASLLSDSWASLILAEPKADLTDELVIKRFDKGKEMVASHVRRETDPNDPAKKWWKYERPGVPFAPDAAKIKEFFKIFEARPAFKALDPQAKDYGFSAPKWQMKLHQDNGEEILIAAGNEDPETQGIFMQVSNKPVVYVFPKYYFGSVDVDDSQFFADNPLAVDPEKSEKIFVHAPSGEVVISPKEDQRDVVKQYLDKLKALRVMKLSFDPAKKIDASSGQLYWIEIKREGVPETAFLYVEGRVLEGGREFLAAKKGDAQPFVISENTFKDLFGNIDALKPAAEKATV